MRKLLIGGLGAAGVATATLVGLATTGGSAAASNTHTNQAWHGKAVSSAAAANAAAAKSSSSATAADSDSKTINLTSHQTHFTFFDLNGDDFGPGDYFVFRERDKQGSQTVGH